MAEALFEPVGERLVPTGLSRGPWRPDALHGGPVAGLVAWAVEATLGPGPGVPLGRHLTRLSVDLVRPVPMAPLDLVTELVRPGKRLQVVDVTLVADGTVVTRGRGVCVRRSPPEEEPPPPSVDDPADRPPGPEDRPVEALPAHWPELEVFHAHGVEVRPVVGSFRQPGRASAWIRLQVPVVAGQPLTGIQRVATLSDFASGLSSDLHFGRHSFINADIDLSLIRPPEGEWVNLDARTHYGEPGSGVALAAVWDVGGRVGAIAQSMVIDRNHPG